MRLLILYVALSASIVTSNGVSTKMNFDEDDGTSLVSNSSITENDDVEVKHTIVVSTKLKNNNNNNRKGVRSSNEDGTLTYHVGEQNNRKSTTTAPTEDSDEVPIIYGYKSVDTTEIKTPDSRYKTKIYPDSLFVTRNIRDQYDNVYPNVAANPMQWRPASFYNNINYRGQDGMYNPRKPRPNYQQDKLNRKISEEGMREFYCKKCIEFSGGQGNRCGRPQTPQQRSVPHNSWLHEATTVKVKIDGKLAKLN